MTSGSAFMAANGARSASCQRRISRRDVRNASKRWTTRQAYQPGGRTHSCGTRSLTGRLPGTPVSSSATQVCPAADSQAGRTWQNERDPEPDADLGLVRVVHAIAAAGLLGAGASWPLHYLLRPSCPDGFVHVDFGVPALIGGAGLVLGGRQAWRVRTPARHGIVAAGLALMALAAGALAVAALRVDRTRPAPAGT